MTTLGEYRVGITFNPSANPQVAELKWAAARFIDLCSTIEIPLDSDAETRCEVARLIALAMTHAEDAAMWAVKAATKTKRE
jgi:hypothetical protein